jgi:hypothetical protein
MNQDRGKPKTDVNSRAFGASGLGHRPAPPDKVELGFGGSGLGGRPKPPQAPQQPAPSASRSPKKEKPK